MIVGLEEAQAEHNRTLSIGHQLSENHNRVLYENKKDGRRITMGELLDGIPEGSLLRSHTAIMVENTRRYLDSMEETTKLVNIGDFEKYAFPMVRAIFPNLAAHNLASVQPMLGPVSLVFFMKFLYGLTKGAAVAGQDVIENPNQSYGSEDIDVEEVGTGTGAATNFTGTLTYLPVKPGTLVFTSVVGAVTLECSDDGNGNIIGDIGAGTNTINYSTGAFDFDFSSAPDSGEAVNAAYSFDMEANDTVPSIDMQLTSSPVTARTRKLRTRWSLEAAQDLRNLHGLEAEIEQVAAVSNELKFEIDREIIDNMDAIGANTGTPFSKTPLTGISFTEHKLNFVDTLIADSNAIFSATQRALGTWMVCGINVASLVESLPGFVPSPRPRGTRAVYKAGVLNGQWDVWKDPNFSTDRFLMGYQGDAMWEVGFIFAPYILAFTTATIMLDDFIGRKGMASRYGKKTIDRDTSRSLLAGKPPLVI
jgi:hypothetical protein